jgi:hypothetical protein
LSWKRARREHEGIARGFHQLRVIRSDRFAQRLERKKSGE